MPAQKYEPIYQSIKYDIQKGVYNFGDFLPSENVYKEIFNCTRNTIRRALSILTQEGYLLPQHGKGVKVIYMPTQKDSLFFVGGIESIKEASIRNKVKVITKVINFKEIKVDEKLQQRTGFNLGDDIYYIERVRYINEKPTIFDINYFLKSETPGLSESIASKSVYQYLEEKLGMKITTSLRYVSAQKATNQDKKMLALNKSTNFLLVVEGKVFNAKGTLFEFTESRHVPDKICFVESAVRQKI